MHLGPTFPRGDSPLQNKTREHQKGGFGSQQAWRLQSEGHRNWGNLSRVGGRGNAFVQHNTSNPHSWKPLAQAGEPHLPDPVARLIDSTEMFTSANSTNDQSDTAAPTATTIAYQDGPNMREDPGIFVATVPEDVLVDLRSKCTTKASVSLIGRIQGKHPGLNALTAWARETLHSSFVRLTLKANNVFEVDFGQPEGRIHTLNQADLTCGSTTIFFSS